MAIGDIKRAATWKMDLTVLSAALSVPEKDVRPLNTTIKQATQCRLQFLGRRLAIYGVQALLIKALKHTGRQLALQEAEAFKAQRSTSCRIVTGGRQQAGCYIPAIRIAGSVHCHA